MFSLYLHFFLSLSMEMENIFVDMLSFFLFLAQFFLFFSPSLLQFKKHQIDKADKDARVGLNFTISLNFCQLGEEQQVTLNSQFIFFFSFLFFSFLLFHLISFILFFLF